MESKRVEIRGPDSNRGKPLLVRHDANLVRTLINKPWFIGETNGNLTQTTWPAGSAQAQARAAYMQDRLNNVYPSLGVSGALLWSYDPSHYDDFNIYPTCGDPVVDVLVDAAASY